MAQNFWDRLILCFRYENELLFWYRLFTSLFGFDLVTRNFLSPSKLDPKFGGLLSDSHIPPRVA